MRTLTLLGLTLLVGCTTPTPAPTTPSAGTSTLDGSWIDAVVDEPGRFSTLASGEAREGWVALHSNDLGAAAKAFAGSDTPIARGRALWELAELHHGLADSGDRAWENTFATWSEKSTLPVGSALSYVAALAAIEQGDQQLAGAWLELTANAKDPEVALAASLLATAQPGQPIAGTEHSGVEASFPDLYRQRRVILTPLADTDPAALARVEALWRACGARVTCMAVDHHDEVLAATSHLPHMLAFSLVDALARMKENDEIFRYAAGGFRDFTRIASSNPVMWRDICIANRDALGSMLKRFADELHDLAEALEDADEARLLAIFQRAKAARDRYVDRVPASGNGPE